MQSHTYSTVYPKLFISTWLLYIYIIHISLSSEQWSLLIFRWTCQYGKRHVNIHIFCYAVSFSVRKVEWCMNVSFVSWVASWFNFYESLKGIAYSNKQSKYISYLYLFWSYIFFNRTLIKSKLHSVYSIMKMKILWWFTHPPVVPNLNQDYPYSCHCLSWEK